MKIIVERTYFAEIEFDDAVFESPRNNITRALAAAANALDDSDFQPDDLGYRFFDFATGDPIKLS